MDIHRYIHLYICIHTHISETANPTDPFHYRLCQSSVLSPELWQSLQDSVAVVGESFSLPSPMEVTDACRHISCFNSHSPILILIIDKGVLEAVHQAVSKLV